MLARISPLALIKWPVGNPARHYADIRSLDAALAAQSWPGVVAYFAELPPEHDPSVAVSIVARRPRLENFLETAGGGPTESPLAALLLGARLVDKGWRIRTTGPASTVGATRFRAFHEHLRRADDLLSDVTAAEPNNIAAWTTRVRIARGLELGQAEARRRYEAAAAARPHPYEAQLSLVQQLCPKWGGSVNGVLQFARQCVADAPPGSLNGAVLAVAHVEVGLEQGFTRFYLRRPAVDHELLAAFEKSVDHAAFQPVHGWVHARNIFAYTLTEARRHLLAARQFAALDRRIVELAWLASLSPRYSFKSRQVTSFVLGGWRG